jgi:primase-polymerase (primpol)-like protein
MAKITTSKLSHHEILPSLKNQNHWICWSFDKDPDSNSKIPLNIQSFLPKKGRFEPGDYDDRSNWLSYERAIYYLFEYDAVDGVGFVFISTDFSWIDIDDCIHKEYQYIDEEIKYVLDQVESYAELSPSKTGIHVFSRGNAPNYGWSSDYYDLDISVFDESWSTVTQKHIQGYPADLSGSQHRLNWICQEYDIGKHGDNP